MKSESKNRKVLIFIDWFLPGDRSGGPVRSVANLIDHLKTEYSFSVVTRDTDYMEDVPYSAIVSDEWNVRPDGIKVYYSSESGLNKTLIKRLIKEEKPDVIYLNGIFSVPFTLWPLRIIHSLAPHTEVVIAARGMLSPAALNIKSFKKKLFLSFARVISLFRRVTFHATGDHEVEDIRSVLGADTKVLVAANLPRKTPVRMARSLPYSKNKLRILCLARIAPEKNQLFALECLRYVHADIEVDFIGAEYNEDYTRQCKDAVELLPQNVRVSFKPAVASDNVVELMLDYDILLLPSRSENYGHSIVEALSCGIPVLISDKTPWRNLTKHSAGWDVELSDPKVFSARIDEFARMSQEERDKWHKGAQNYAGTIIQNENTVEAYRKLFG